MTMNILAKTFKISYNKRIYLVFDFKEKRNIRELDFKFGGTYHLLSMICYPYLLNTSNQRTLGTVSIGLSLYMREKNNQQYM